MMLNPTFPLTKRKQYGAATMYPYNAVTKPSYPTLKPLGEQVPQQEVTPVLEALKDLRKAARMLERIDYNEGLQQVKKGLDYNA
jgi:hypothetical protein